VVVVSTEIRADPLELARTARAFLRESQGLGDALRAAQASATPPGTAYGDTAGAAGLQQAVGRATEAAGEAVGLLVEVLEVNVDLLYRLAFATETAIRDARRAMQAWPLP
jgi:hypothetical protein